MINEKELEILEEINGLKLHLQRLEQLEDATKKLIKLNEDIIKSEREEKAKKSTMSLEWLYKTVIDYAGEHPKSAILLVAQHREQTLGLMKTFDNMIPNKITEYKISERYLILLNGSTIHFASKDEYNRFRGFIPSFVGIIGCISDDIIERLRSCDLDALVQIKYR